MELLRQLDENSLLEGVNCLVGIEPAFAGIYQACGLPPLWTREVGFPTLVHIILEQQVSLSSARAAFSRLSAAGALTPTNFLEYDDATLKGFGFSRQKTSYVRHLAQLINEGKLDLAALEQHDDATVRAELLRVKGIGNWTADIYLMMALRRSNIFPAGDLALQVAFQQVKKLGMRPTSQEMEILSLTWQPWRSVAAFLLWHHYLSRG